MSASAPGGCATLIVLSGNGPLEALVTRLRTAGIDARGVRSFEGARDQLNRRAWDVLVTEVRLGAYNGLHLAVRTHATYPHTAIVIVGDSHDPAVEAEVVSLGGRYVASPTAAELSDLITSLCGCSRDDRTRAADDGSLGAVV